MDEALGRLEERAGKGWATARTRCSCPCARGARESMPGMMDTVLNLGLNDESVEGLAQSDRQRALRLGLLPPLRADVRQRLPRASPASATRTMIAAQEAGARASRTTPSSRSTTSRSSPATSSRSTRDETGEDFPQEPREQLRQAIRAVFDSWTGRARRSTTAASTASPTSWGTAVNVQQMVFGNKGEDSCSGVAFSRDEITGAPEPSGRLPGERAGRGRGVGRAHAAGPLRDEGGDARGARRPDGDPAHARAALRRHAGHRVHGGGGQPLHAPDAQRQAARPRPRCGSRSTPSRRGCSRQEEALATIDAESLDALLHPTFERDAEYEVLARGVNASPGAAKGEIVFTAEDAVEAAEDGRDVVLVRPFTEADDVARLPRGAGASSPRRAARPATRRSWRAAWAGRAWRARRTLDIDLARRRSA